MSSRISEANKRYYSSKGKNIYSDFSTFAQGKALSTCNAIEFCNDFENSSAPVTVCEYGVGKGDFAKTFLDEVKKRNKKLYSRVRYYLFDISEKMLDAARKNLHAHHDICIFGKFDAALDAPDLAFDYCRINELVTDLHAQIYMKQGSKILELVPQ
ncbi:MAG: SAM-dependent methyltransferase, partial [Candidatus Micrarchaeota archaeon]|nr:SAM-dependent methyltransferase [Candidatus Micrarchaeota archaeon]